MENWLRYATFGEGYKMLDRETAPYWRVVKAYADEDAECRLCSWFWNA